jgi:predicted TPR repeat methyltransferase
MVAYPSLTNSELFYHPVGNTDSEATFCAILNALRAEFTELPTLPVLYETLQRLCAQIVQGHEDETILNFLLGCGQYTLFAYSWPGARPGSKVWNGLYYTTRKPPFARAQLADCDYAVDFSTCTKPNDRVAVIATAPLTVDEEWIEFKRGELKMFDNGLAFSELYDCEEVEKQGRGLYSRAVPRQSLASGTDNPQQYYDTPSRLRAIVDKTVGPATSNCDPVWAKTGADLGCGIGCSGKAFRSCVKHLIGVDLSPEMVDKARERGCYDELVLGNVECVLRKQSKGSKPCKNKTHGALAYQKFDLIFACNVFVYIQDLKNVFYDIRQIMDDTNGIFAFSAEFIDMDDDGVEDPAPYVLQACARYAHKRWYLEQITHEFGFVTKSFVPSLLQRSHAGHDVYGVLVVLGVQ